MSLKNLKVRTQLFFLVGIIMTLMILMAGVAIVNISNIGKELKEIADEDMPLIEKITEITEHQLEQAIWFERALRHGEKMAADEKEARLFHRSEKEFEKIAKMVDKEIIEGEKIAEEGIKKAHSEHARKEFQNIYDHLKIIEKEHAEYERHVMEIFELQKHGKMEKALELAEKVEAEEDQLNHELEKFLKQVEEFTRESLLLAEQHEKSTVNILSIILICSLTIGFLIAYFIIRSILGQVGGEPAIIAGIAKRVASGQFDIEQSSEETTGIFSELIKMANSLKTAIASIQSTMHSLSLGDFTNPVGDTGMTGELTLIKDSINNTIEMLDQTITQVLLSSEQVSTGANEISNASQGLAAGTTEQAASLEETNSSMLEVGSRAKGNNENAGQAAQLTSQAMEIVSRGNEQMANMLASMDKINNSSAAISKIIKVIDEIAFQTNLLALNAAVEAARAGKYGKGFAVVAEEVRSLASRSAEAAKNTTELIENSVKEVEQGVSNAGMTAGVLNEVNQSIVKVNDLVAEIATSSKEQSSSTDEVNEALTQINNVVQQNSSISEETASSSEELNSQAIELQGLMSRFKLKQTGSTRKQTPVQPAVVQPKLPEEKVAVSQKMITLDDDNFGKY